MRESPSFQLRGISGKAILKGPSIYSVVRRGIGRVILLLPLFACLAEGFQFPETAEERLKGLSLEQLGNTEVTTVSKGPVRVSRTAAAIYVITQEDIRRSGATSLPEALRLAP